MKSNVKKDLFGFLKQQHLSALYDLANSAQQYLYTDPNTALVNLRMYSDAILKYIYTTEGISEPAELTPSERLEFLLTKGIIHSNIYKILNYTSQVGTKAMHDPSFGSIEEAKTLLKCAYYLGVWLKQIYGTRIMGLSLYYDPFMVLGKPNNLTDHHGIKADPVVEKSPVCIETIITFNNDDSGYEEWLKQNQSGYVFNDCGGSVGSKTKNKIHQADCHYLLRKKEEGKRTTVFKKICSTSLTELEEHVLQLKGNAWVNCKSCIGDGSASINYKNEVPI